MSSVVVGINHLNNARGHVANVVLPHKAPLPYEHFGDSTTPMKA
jgi:hypothetical protein